MYRFNQLSPCKPIRNQGEVDCDVQFSQVTLHNTPPGLPRSLCDMLQCKPAMYWFNNGRGSYRCELDLASEVMYVGVQRYAGEQLCVVKTKCYVVCQCCLRHAQQALSKGARTCCHWYVSKAQIAGLLHRGTASQPAAIWSTSGCALF